MRINVGGCCFKFQPSLVTLRLQISFIFILRLEKMRAALSKRRYSEEEITVKTAKGEEFRFGGISEKFTRKLYEWEEQKGIAPESSTIALLQNNNLGNEADGERRAGGPADHEGTAGGRYALGAHRHLDSTDN